MAANKSTKILWIPRDKLNCSDVVHGYFSLQKEFKELDGFLSNANQIPPGDKETNIQTANDEDEDNMEHLEY